LEKVYGFLAINRRKGKHALSSTQESERRVKEPEKRLEIYKPLYILVLVMDGAPDRYSEINPSDKF
jgi:hypothetical protein